MKKRTPRLLPRRLLALLLAPVLLLASCETVAETGRTRWKIYTDPAQEAALGLEAYQQILGENKLITSGPKYDMVVRIGNKIAQAAEARAQQMGLPAYNFQWEFNLLDSPTVNAFCLPGGKVAVYTGILPIADNEDKLAAIMGHEVAHATLRHGGERMTQNVFSQGLLTVSALGMSMSGLEEATQATVMGAINAGAQYGILLPYSRGHETEADSEGLRYLITAGYDPYEAPKLWESMAKLGGGERPPEFMSTHPDPLARAETLRQLIPQYMKDSGRLKQIER